MEDLIINSRHKVVGTKQTMKALEKDEASLVFVAGDAEEKVIRPIVSICETNDVELKRIDTMAQLGKLFGIKIRAAAAAILKED